METIVNNPGTTRESSGAGWIVAIIVALVAVALLLFWILPRYGAAPQENAGGVNVPDQIDVNIGGGAGAGEGGE